MHVTAIIVFFITLDCSKIVIGLTGLYLQVKQLKSSALIHSKNYT
jgi:hypothetical protein